jgi:integrase
MLTLRKRGRYWHVRGTVRVGKKTVEIAEHSSGVVDRASAEKYRVRLQIEAQEGILDGAASVRRKIGFADAALYYLDAKRHHLAEISRVRQLSRAFSDVRLSEIDATAFAMFARDELSGRSSNTVERARVTLAAIFKAAGVESPTIPSYAHAQERIRWLPHDKADRLIRWYAPHARPIAMVARFCGLRASENLLLEVGQCDPSWGAHGAFHIRHPKNGRDRVVPWTADIRVEVIKRITRRPDTERLWLTQLGEPYADTRLVGGNPIRRAHNTACHNAGIQDFTWHDWRHHWATWALQPEERGGFGWDLIEVAKVGGWEDLASVKRYAAVMLDRVAATFENLGNGRAIAR